MAEHELMPVPGSERQPMRGAHRIGPAPADERFEVTVRVRRRAPLPAAALDGTVVPSRRRYMTHAALNAAHGADPADLSKVEVFGRQYGLTVRETSAARRTVLLSGTAADFSKAFHVVLEHWQHPRGRFRGRTGPIQVPRELASIIVGVFGLDNRPFAKPHFRRFKRPSAQSQFQGYTALQVASFYNFPTAVNGAGQVIGIIELGGGYRTADLTTYFKEVGVSPAPSVTAVSVDNGKNAPTTADSADGEVLLDIEVAASVAPGAKIVVYFAAGTTDQYFLDAITQAVHDETNDPSVISISWGGPEAAASGSFQTQFDDVLQSAAALGITVTIASGDDGAADEGPNEWDNQSHADFPASSPYALACGATNIQVTANQIKTESVWNQHEADTQDDSFGSSGGGISTYFPVPSYQKGIVTQTDISTGKAGRGLPDVSGDGDPASGYRVRVDGQEFPIGGTSAVAPLWAGLIALVNQKLGHRVGFINPLLYANASALRDITIGDNKVGTAKLGYVAAPGWDPCTGLGSPDGGKLLTVLGG